MARDRKMNILSSLLKQQCVYWPPGELDRFGKRTYGLPSVLACAYELTRRTINQPNGTSFEISATVNLAESVEEEGWLWVGDIRNAPSVPDDQMRIKMVTYHSDTEDNEKLWKAMV